MASWPPPSPPTTVQSPRRAPDGPGRWCRARPPGITVGDVGHHVSGPAAGIPDGGPDGRRHRLVEGSRLDQVVTVSRVSTITPTPRSVSRRYGEANRSRFQDSPARRPRGRPPVVPADFGRPTPAGADVRRAAVVAQEQETTPAGRAVALPGQVPVGGPIHEAPAGRSGRGPGRRNRRSLPDRRGGRWWGRGASCIRSQQRRWHSPAGGRGSPDSPAPPGRGQMRIVACGDDAAGPSEPIRSSSRLGPVALAGTSASL